MNERMMRAAPKAAAEFITAFSDGEGQLGDSTWLVWAYEGDYTLSDLMQARARCGAERAAGRVCWGAGELWVCVSGRWRDAARARGDRMRSALPPWARRCPVGGRESCSGRGRGCPADHNPLGRVVSACAQKKEFPYNLEQSLFGRELNIPRGPERKAAILRVATQQLLECLEACHAVGAWLGLGEGRGPEPHGPLRLAGVPAGRVGQRQQRSEVAAAGATVPKRRRRPSLAQPLERPACAASPPARRPPPRQASCTATSSPRTASCRSATARSS